MVAVRVFRAPSPAPTTRKGHLAVRKCNSAIVPRPRFERSASAVRAFRACGSSVLRPRSDSQLPFASSQLPFAGGQLPFAGGQLPFASGQLPHTDTLEHGPEWTWRICLRLIIR